MANDKFSDYEDLLSMFEDKSEKTPEAAEPTVEEDLKTKRKKKVEDFKIDVNSNSGSEKPGYKGGVYFSNPPRDIEKAAQREKRETARRTSKAKAPVEKFKVSAPPATAKQKKKIAEKEAKNEKFKKTFLGKLLTSEKLSRFALAIAIIALSSVVLCIYGIRCINDVLAINVEDTAIEVEVSKGMSDADVIDVLKDHDLIENELFCNLFIKFFGKDGDYVSGVYTLSPSMGVEKMLSTMKADITLSETVTLTFPEGWTIDQIAEKLEANEVCTAASFINTLQSVDFSEDYEFIKSIPNKEKRFRVLEGYMYPDTYEFYVGENASSVARRFLDNFRNRWTDEYAKQAEERGISLDEVITMASILQGEAASSKQMPDVSSVLYNRLNRPGTFPKLECDSTKDYIKDMIMPTLTNSTEDGFKLAGFYDSYDTYDDDCRGLPVGAIGNPGDSAIRAALYPSDTNYYYFCHNVETGEVFYANTMSEHEANQRKAGIS